MYAGLLHEGEGISQGALKEGGFEVIVSGHRKGTGSSRETAPQCEWSGIRIVIAASFAPYIAQQHQSWTGNGESCDDRTLQG